MPGLIWFWHFQIDNAGLRQEDFETRRFPKTPEVTTPILAESFPHANHPAVTA